METFNADVPLFDRERAWREFESLVSEARERGAAATIRVCGPAGIGKTTFLDSALARRPDFPGALRCAAEPNDRASPGIAVRRLLRTTASSPLLDEASLTTQLCEALLTAPFLCIDDVQWLDEVSRRIVRAAVHLAGTRIMSLFGDRREEAPELRPHQTIFLAPLRRSAALKLVRTVYPEVAAATANEIVAASSGIPFDLVFLAGSAAREHAHGGTAPEASAGAAISRRLQRSSGISREILRHAACVDAYADIRHLARTMELDVTGIAGALDELSDLAMIADLRITFRHASIAAAIRSATPNPLGYYRRLLAALDEHDDRPVVLETRLHCARACGADTEAAACSLQLGRALAAAASLEVALHYFELAIGYVSRPIPLEYVADYAGVLQQLSRDEEAAAFLRRELDSALVRGDARHAAGLLVSFYSAALTLERFGELRILCDRVLRLNPDIEARRLLLTARTSTLAFAGNIDEYDRLTDGADLRWADCRPASFLAALRGDVDGAMRSYVAYHGELKPEHARQNPSDHVLQATNAMFETGMTALEAIEGLPSAAVPVRAHPAAAGLKLLRRIAYGQWAAASAMIEEIPFWDTSYDEPYGILDLRLLYSALARQRPRAQDRTIGSLRRMIARRQVRHAVSPARWYMLAMSSSGADTAPDIAAFVTESLEVVPMPYLFGGLPLSIAMLASLFGRARCAAALKSWPTYGSRWHRAHVMLAHGLLTEENTALRQARDAFDGLRAPVFAMLAGIALPVPRARDLALAAMLGQRPSIRQRLTPRESDVAELAATGARNREIAEKLNISERTVEVHLTSAFRKLGVRSRGGLAQRLMNREGSSAS